jgi:serine/threonine protein kinase/tetratricopeptide (TPR) repeat protein
MLAQAGPNYRVLERLGGGSMGEVYLAEDVRLKRPVALKLLRGPDVQDDAAKERLLREARTASALNHPNIAVIYEVGELPAADGAARFIAMEYVRGRTLARLKDEAPGLDAVLDVARQIAEGLSEAHARGVVHRDVKPTNVMLTESGRVKLLDFGLASRQLLPSETDSTWSRGAAVPRDEGALIGTLAYMAPEQALGKEVDGRADVFSLGVLLYELLSGRRPFEGANAIQVLDGILRRDPAPLDSRFADPRLAHVEAVVRKMLAKEPESRYSMREAVAELAAVQAGAAPRLAEPASPPARAIAVTPFVNISRNGEDDWLGTGIAETVTADLKMVEGLTVLSRERIHEAMRQLGLVPEDEALPVRLGRELGVRWVLSGGLQRSGDSLRVTARLSEIATGEVVQTFKVDGRVSEVFEVQDRIARELMRALGPAPASAAFPNVPEETQVLGAYEAFSKGVINLRLESYESLDRAAWLFERAIALDPNYARAHLELATACATKADYLGLPELHEKALPSFRRALELRPGLVRAWRELGSSLVMLGREGEGLQAIRRALELDPGDAGTLGAMGRAAFIGQARFEDAIGWYERALARNPKGGWYALQLAHAAALARDFARGTAAARLAVELQEAALSGQEGVRIVGAHMRMGHIAALQGRPAEALQHFERERTFLERVDHALRSRSTIELHMRKGAAELATGAAAAARASLDAALSAFEQRVRQGADEPFTRYYAACAYALRGDHEQAVACLLRAAELRRVFTIARARIEPEWDSLRDMPQFRNLVL